MNRRLVEDMRQELADLYADSCATEPGEECRARSREEFLNRLTGEIRRPGFSMVIAESDGLVGCALGFPVRGDGFRWLGFDGELPSGIEQLAEADGVFTDDAFAGDAFADGVFAITDILVAPHLPDRHLVRRLQEGLLAGQQSSLGTTLVDQADHSTLDAFRSRGWQDIGEVWRPTGHATFRVLVLPLGERTGARLEGLAHHVWTRWPG